MQPTRAAESGWTTAPGATSIGIRSRSAPAAVVAPPPANAKSSGEQSLLNAKALGDNALH